MTLIKSILITIFIALISITNSHASQNKHTAWEYLSESIDHMGDEVINTKLNKLGKKGWELVNCPTIDAILVCIFKRPKSK